MLKFGLFFLKFSLNSPNTQDFMSPCLGSTKNKRCKPRHLLFFSSLNYLRGLCKASEDSSLFKGQALDSCQTAVLIEVFLGWLPHKDPGRIHDMSQGYCNLGTFFMNSFPCPSLHRNSRAAGFESVVKPTTDITVVTLANQKLEKLSRGLCSG